MRKYYDILLWYLFEKYYHVVESDIVIILEFISGKHKLELLWSSTIIVFLFVYQDLLQEYVAVSSGIQTNCQKAVTDFRVIQGSCLKSTTAY